MIPKKAVFLSYSSSIFLLAVGGFLANGCSYRDKRDEEKARKSAEISEKIQTEKESERVRVAKSDLQSRISGFEGIEGEYQGSYTFSSASNKILISRLPDTRFSVRMRISASNIPPEYLQVRATHESEVLGQIEGMRLLVDVFEGDTSLNLVHVTCSATDVKPDFFLGIVRFTCPASAASPSRTFNLALDYLPEIDNVYGEDDQSGAVSEMHPLLEIRDEVRPEYQRSSAVANALLKQRLRKIEVLNVEMISPDVTTRGRIVRKVNVR